MTMTLRMHSVEMQEFFFYAFLREINFWKLGTLAIFEANDFAFSLILLGSQALIFQNSIWELLKLSKYISVFWDLEFTKRRFHVKSEH